jgi:hypothetical protein
MNSVGRSQKVQSLGAVKAHRAHAALTARVAEREVRQRAAAAAHDRPEVLADTLAAVLDPGQRHAGLPLTAADVQQARRLDERCGSIADRTRAYEISFQ